MSAIQAAERFLQLRRIAFVGVSRDRADFSRRVYEAFLARGYDVVPVNPAVPDVDGRPAFASVAEITPPVEGAYFLVPPAVAERAAREALDAGVRQLWFHRGGGPGAASPAALAQCAAAGVTPVTDLCPFMVLPGTGFGHRLHGWFRRRKLAAERA
ncbi:MAG TPA: CoA-binding protein [Anaeromyxobacter sp.]|nr:CoA-binding protein [Anaeromyxobacter sp.]